MSRRWLRAILLIASLAHPVVGQGESPPAEWTSAPPIPWQDAGPFAQIFLQLPFDAPEPVGPGRLQVSMRTLYSNSVVGERTADLSVDVSVETAVPMAFVRYGLPRGFELELAVPGVIGYAGFLARPIKLVESLFGAGNPLRVGPPPRKARFRVLRRDGSGVDWSGMGGSAGDPWAGLKRRVRLQDGWAPALSWRAALKVPISGLPFGSGVLEVGTGLLASWALGATSLRLAADAMIPSAPYSPPEIRTRPHFALQLGAARRFTPWLTAMLQASVHTSALAGTGIGAVDGAARYLLVGIALEPSRRTSVEFALVENVLHASRGADISAVVELGRRW